MIEWPEDITEAIDKSIQFKLVGVVKYEVLQVLLDSILCRAMQVYGDNPEQVSKYIDAVPTVIGELYPWQLPNIDGVEQFKTVGWQNWEYAVHRIHDHIRNNATKLIADLEITPLVEQMLTFKEVQISFEDPENESEGEDNNEWV